MQSRILILLIASIFILNGCGSSKKTVQIQESPSWVKARPAIQLYYVGIGSARKTGDPNSYMQTAKQNALADMASDISINISSNSVLSAFESQQRYFEDYSSTIRANAQKDLEGYEVVDTWEDSQSYWVYYRLSKDTYRKLVEEKKNNAISKSLDFYDKAIKSIENNDIRVGLVLLVKALEPIKPYFAETIMAKYNGTDIFLGNEIIQALSSTLNNLSVSGPNDLSVKMGKPVSQSELQFMVNYKQIYPQKGFPLKANYTEKPITQSKTVTEANGSASYGIDAVRSTKSTERFKVTMDFEAIVYESTTDFTIRKLLSRLNAPMFEVIINISKPSFYIVSIEKNIGNVMSENLLAEAAKRKLVEDGLPIVNNQDNADYILTIDGSTVQTSKSKDYKQATLAAIISVKKHSGVEVYRKSLDGVIGTHFNIEMAGKNAYSDAAKKVENTVMREIIEVVVKGKSSY
ncbi:MAG: LPP20 family lipoprotein [Bacteroidales bacterium]